MVAVMTERPRTLHPTAELVVVTPDMAREWLGRNENNRNVRLAKVDTYAAAMQSGDWIVTGEGVKFDWTGRLFDGQHRLLAVIDANAPVAMFVFRNLNPEAQAVVDTGAKRSAADALKWAGVAGGSPNELAAMAKIIILWDEGSYRRSGSGSGREVTNSEIVEWATNNTDLAHEFIHLTARIVNKGKGFPTPSKAALAAALFILHRVDREFSEQFADDLLNMRMNGKGDPIYTLFGRMTYARNTKENMRAPGQLFCYFRTWNAIVDGERLFQLKVGKVGTKSGTSHISIPQPKSPGAD